MGERGDKLKVTGLAAFSHLLVVFGQKHNDLTAFEKRTSKETNLELCRIPRPYPRPYNDESIVNLL